MDQDVDNAIKALAKKVAESSASDEAMKFAQAALNLAHVEATRANTNSKPASDNRKGQIKGVRQQVETILRRHFARA